MTVLSALGLFKLLKQAVPGHYRVFTGAGQAMWSGGQPYANDFGTGIGYYFYSPFSALFVFGPLSALPEKLGLIVYMGVSWTALVLAVRYAAGHVRRAEGWATFSRRGEQWFWAILASSIYLSILASKLELLMAAILIFAITLFAYPRANRVRDRLCAGFLLALIVNWKMQPLPIFGLVALTAALTEGLVPLLLGAGLGFAVATALPWLILGDRFVPLVQEQLSTLSAFSAGAWENVDNLAAFFLRVLRWESLTLSMFTALGLGFGVLLSWFVTFRILKRRKVGHHRRSGALHEGAWLAGALGSLFIVAFSPASTNNSYVLLAPAAFATVLFLSRLRTRGFLFGVAATCWVVLALAYSDLVPGALKHVLREGGLKPFAAIVLALVFCTISWRDHWAMDGSDPQAER